MANTYPDYITSLHRPRVNFGKVVETLTQPIVELTALYDAMRSSTFDVDVALGAQLDMVGLWVGISRRQSVPIENVWFSWDDSDLGWNFANWKGPYEPAEGVVNLDDETYRAVIKAKIAANYWDGSIADLDAIGASTLLDLGVQCFIVDNFDMSITVYILGNASSILIELIKRGIIPPKTAGVRITGYILASEPGSPFFALSEPTGEFLAGLDFGSFGDPV